MTRLSKGTITLMLAGWKKLAVTLSVLILCFAAFTAEGSSTAKGSPPSGGGAVTNPQPSSSCLLHKKINRNCPTVTPLPTATDTPLPTATDTPSPTATATRPSGGSITVQKQVCTSVGVTGSCNVDTSQSGNTATFTVYNSDASGTQGTQCGSDAVVTISASTGSATADCATLGGQYYLICETSNTFTTAYNVSPRPSSSTGGTESSVGSCILLQPATDTSNNTVRFLDVHS